ncbi:MAG: hypothetical protein MJ160_03855 [Treponema sp.]|nr:hypothetical protein [Treponema sp.]
MKKLWKIVAGLIVLGAAMVITGCSHEPSYYYDINYVRVSADEYNNEYRGTDFDTFDAKSQSWPADSSYDEGYNLSKAEAIQFFVDKNCNRESVTKWINSIKVNYDVFTTFSSGWDESVKPVIATDDVFIFRVYVHQ